MSSFGNTVAAGLVPAVSLPKGLVLIGFAVLLYWPDQKILTLAMRSNSCRDMTKFLHSPTSLPALCVLALMVMTTACFAVAGFWLLLTGRSFGFERRKAKAWYLSQASRWL